MLDWLLGLINVRQQELYKENTRLRQQLDINRQTKRQLIRMVKQQARCIRDIDYQYHRLNTLDPTTKALGGTIGHARKVSHDALVRIDTIEEKL
ncbi:TPA: hypothetical protein NWA42_002970 [Escherichia coli]|nr:hypothetical protein [Escherichia coli]HCJ9799515.1 hypothetical protein [Escherichia coli]